ncbi:hypothetical protein PGC35_20305 [Psychrobacillus sp. PGGUH221]|uniref:hypothetical protein n=1 Tax=Psychrobacillus sp. PGGUH221 TaxID=3020058 RepID=UPI0035C76276
MIKLVFFGVILPVLGIILWSVFAQDLVFSPLLKPLMNFFEPIMLIDVNMSVGTIIGGIALLGLTLYLFRQQLRKVFLNKISVELDMKHFIKRFTEEANKSHYVIATQIYRYHFSKTSSILRINYQDGYVVEEEPLNAVIQENFRIEKKLYRTLEKAVKNVQRDENDLVLLEDFMYQQIAELEKSPTIVNINKELNQFNFLILAIQFFLNIGNNSRKFLEKENNLVSALNNQQKEDKLYTMSRTGLIRSILNAELGMSALYSFRHIGENEKKGRVYLTIQVKREKESKPYIFLITVSPEIKDEDDQIKIFTEILESFIKVIKSELGEAEIVNLRSLVV